MIITINTITIWIIRTNKISTKDYNYVNRALKKMGFHPRKNTWMTFVKALFYHVLQKKSWRSLESMLNCNYIALHSFYSNYSKHEEIKKIFHYFAEAKVIVFVGTSKYFTNDDLDNNPDYYKLTLNELENIFSMYF